MMQRGHRDELIPSETVPMHSFTWQPIRTDALPDPFTPKRGNTEIPGWSDIRCRSGEQLDGGT